MKFVIVFAALFAVAFAAPADQSAETLRYENDNIGLDHYTYNVETSDGKVVSESGELKSIDADHQAIVVHGSFQYVGTDGVTYTVNYVADENGFQPTGDHIPTIPAIPTSA